ncbi:unnamed protein product [Discula destructiva]
MVKTVVILGGSYGGLHVAHYLLKQKNPDVKVIIVSKSSHFYWNMASVRAIVPDQFKDDALFKPLTAAFERYPSAHYELIIGAAEKVDATTKTVLVSAAAAGEQRTLTYDQLVLATGSRCTTSTVPWKVLDSHDATVANLDQTRARVQAAQSIVIAGAGATGVEVAGELGFEYGATKEITLLSAGPSVLDGDSVGPAARAELVKLGVKIKTDARVADSTTLPDGKTQISLENGETLAADLYLPTMGMKANTEMLDGKFLDEHGYVAVDEFYRVKSLENEGVWAAGDVVSKPRGGFMITQKQAAGVAKNVELALQGKAPQIVKLLPVDIMACAVGRKRGAGRMGPIKMFSIMVYLAKGKTLGTQMMPSYIDGSVA